jgi:CBS domain-containing protein
MRTLVQDLMSIDVAAVRSATAIKAVAELLNMRQCSAVPVVNDHNQVIGVVSEIDVLRHMFTGGTALTVMSSPPITVLADQPAIIAVRRMNAHNVKRLPVVDDLGRLVGIVSRGDLIRAYASGADLRLTPARETEHVE